MVMEKKLLKNLERVGVHDGIWSRGIGMGNRYGLGEIAMLRKHKRSTITISLATIPWLKDRVPNRFGGIS